MFLLRRRTILSDTISYLRWILQSVKKTRHVLREIKEILIYKIVKKLHCFLITMNSILKLHWNFIYGFIIECCQRHHCSILDTYFFSMYTRSKRFVNRYANIRSSEYIFIHFTVKNIFSTIIEAAPSISFPSMYTRFVNGYARLNKY